MVTTFALNCHAMDSKATVTLTERITKTDEWKFYYDNRFPKDFGRVDLVDVIAVLMPTL